MAITRDQLSGVSMATANAASLSVAWGANPTAGATVLVAAYNSSGMPSVVDNGATPTTFTEDIGNNSGAYNVWIFRGSGITLPATGSYTVTVSAGSQVMVAAGISYLGVKSGAPTAVNDNSNSGAGPVSTGSATPGGAGALAFAAFSDFLSSGTDTIALTNASFTERFTQTAAGTSIPGGIADWINPSGPSAANCTWTVSGSVLAWEGAVAVYDAAPAASRPAYLRGIPQAVVTAATR